MITAFTRALALWAAVAPADDAVAPADGVAPPTLESPNPEQSVAPPRGASAGGPGDPLRVPRDYETVITAPPPTSRAPREDSAAAASVVIPDASPRAFDDLGTLLLEVPGVNVTRTGSLGSVSTLALRGSNPDEVRIYVDGVPLAVAAGGGVDISTLPLGDVERVEVYRGSTPLAFAESALGGIVSITTRTPGTPRAAARAGAGSFGTVFADASGGGQVGRLRLYAGAHALSSRGGFGFLDDNGTALNPGDDMNAARANNQVEQVDGVLRASLALGGRRTLGLGALAFAREQGLPARGSTASRARFLTRRAMAYLRYEGRDDLGDGGALDAQLFASSQEDTFDDPVASVAPYPVATYDTTRALGASAHARRPLASWLTAAAVVEGRAERFRPVDGLAPMPVGLPARRLVGVGGAELHVLLRALDLDVIPSARVEVVQDIVTERDAGSAPAAALPPVTRELPVVRLGLVRPLGRFVTVKANGGRYARVPSFLELYGDNGRILGSSELRPERGYNADLGLWVDAAAGRLAVASRTTGFAARVDDLITWAVTPYGAKAQNVGEARVLGVEQELRAGFGRHAALVAQATFMRAEDPGPAGATRALQLPLRPRWRAYARPELARLPVGGGAVELGAFVDGDLVAGRYNDRANLVRLPDRLLVGAGLSADVPRWKLRLAASAQNLGDSRAIDLAYWPLPGRSAFVSLAWTEDFGVPNSNPRSN